MGGTAVIITILGLIVFTVCYVIFLAGHAGEKMNEREIIKENKISKRINDVEGRFYETNKRINTYQSGYLELEGKGRYRFL